MVIAALLLVTLALEVFLKVPQKKRSTGKLIFTAWEGLGCSMQNRISDLPQQRVCGSLLPLRSRFMDIAVSVGLIVGQLKLLGVVESM